ncbi:hypothetical protein GOP47_0009993, partial [Adiantum capillus-veneris]
GDVNGSHSATASSRMEQGGVDARDGDKKGREAIALRPAPGPRGGRDEAAAHTQLINIGGVLIPGLPNHIAIKCLVQVPRLYHGNMRGVCRSWMEVVRSAEFYIWRRESGVTDPWLVVLSCDHLGSTKLDFFAYDLPSRQLLFKARLPPFDAVKPSCSSSTIDMIARGASSDYKLVAMDEHFVVLNWQRDGVWTEELPFLIYNILRNSWKKGASVSVRRHSFCCGVVQGKLYVTGGVNMKGTLERSTECYDFAKDEWRFVAALPVPLVLEDDAVFTGKLYVRTKCKEFWVYDPIADFWAQDPCLSMNSRLSEPSLHEQDDELYGQQGQAQAANEGQLVATDKSLLSLTPDNAFYKFNRKEKAWQLVGKINAGYSVHNYKASASAASNYRTAAAGRSSNDESMMCKEARRVFAYGNDIFVLASGKPGWHSRFLQDEDGCKYHRLFLGASSYRAGAVVQA